MAIYHYSEGNVSRATGRSACAAAAYITGSRINDARQGITFDYGKRNDVVMVFGNVPEEAPEWAKTPEGLWNEVASFEDALLTKRFKGNPGDPEKNEKSLRAREDAIASAIEANSIILALPREFTPLQSKEVIKAFMTRYLSPRNLLATAAIHDEKDNPHCHLLVTTRALEGETFSSKKCRDFNNTNELKVRRALWAEVVNLHAKEWGINIKIDHRSYEEQGIDLIPTVHEGWYAKKHLGASSRLVQENEEIRQENIKLLFKNPQELIRLAASKAPVVNKNDLLKEIFKRVEGDEALWHLLSDSLNAYLKGHEYDLEHLLADKPSNANTPSPMEDSEKSLVCERLLTGLEKKGVLVHLGQDVKGQTFYTSGKMKEKESHFEEKVVSLKKMTHHGISPRTIQKFVEKVQKEKGFVLEDEQNTALLALCSDQGICVLEGRAGTGKTFVLSAVKNLYEKKGFKLLGGAFQGRTAEHLEHETGVFSHTLDVYARRWKRLDEIREKLSTPLCEKERNGLEALFSYLQAYELTPKTVFMVDEAFMAPTHLLEALVTRAEEKGAKIILAGDGRQTLSFTSGDAGRCVSKHVTSVCLENIRRQKAEWQRTASLYLSRHDVWEGYSAYEEKGHIFEHKTKEDVYDALTRAYVTHLTKEGDVTTRAQETLLLAPDSESVKELNKRVISLLKEEGHFKKGFVLSNRYEKLVVEETLLREKLATEGLTQDKRQALESHLASLDEKKSILEKERVFYEGQRIVFTSNDHRGFHMMPVLEGEEKHGVKNGTQGVISAFEEGTVYVVLDDGKKVSFLPKACPDEEKEFVESGYAMTVHKAQGLTRKSTYGLFLEQASTRHVTANLLYVLGTRHTDTFKGYFFSEKELSFKDYLITKERSEYRPLVSDYVIDEPLTVAHARVREYLEIKIEKGQILQSVGEVSEKEPGDPLSKNTLDQIYQITRELLHNETETKRSLSKKSLRKILQRVGTLLEKEKGDGLSKSTLEKVLIDNKFFKDLEKVLWEKYGDLKVQQGKLARSMINDGIKNHTIFLHQAGISLTSLYVEAGEKERTLSLFEKECARRVEDYAEVADKTRMHWTLIKNTQMILEDHPLYADFKNLKTERDFLAYGMVEEGLKPFTRFLRNKQMAKKTVLSHAKSHEEFLKEQALKALNPDFVKNLEGYKEAGRAFQRAKLSSQDTHEHLKVRDQKAYVFLNSLKEGDQALVEHFLTSKAQDALLHQGSRHEGRLLIEAYEKAPTLLEKSTFAKELVALKNMSVLFKGTQINPQHLSFEICLATTKTCETHDPEQQKIFLARLDGWKNSDLARRKMFASAYKERQIATEEANKKPPLVVDRGVVERFETASIALYDLIACEKDALSPHPLFEQMAKAAFHGIKDRHKKEALSALKETLPKKTPTLQRQDVSKFVEQVLSDMDVAAFSTRFIESHGLSVNQRLSRGEALRFGKKGSLLVQVEGSKKGSWISFEENKSGNLISLITHFQGGTFKDALSALKPHVSPSLQKDFELFCQGHRPLSLATKRVMPGTKKETPEIDYEAIKIAQVQKIVEMSTPVKETQAETYLSSRGITKFHEADLAYLPANTSFEYGNKKRIIGKGALLSIARNDNGEIQAVQVTHLDGRGQRAKSYDGEKFQKLTYGVPRGAYVTLSRGQGPLFLSEGVETGLSLVEAKLQGTVKAALGVYNMSHVTTDKNILLVADWDGVGASSHTTIQKAQTHLRLVTGKDVNLLWPAKGGNKKDFNDVLCREGKSGLKRILHDEANDLQQKREREVAKTEESLKHFEDSYFKMNPATLKIRMNPSLQATAHEVLSSLHGRLKVTQMSDPALKEAFYRHALAHEKETGIATFLTLNAYEKVQKELSRKDLAEGHKDALSKTAEEMAYRLSKADHFKYFLKGRFSQDAHQTFMRQAQNHKEHLSRAYENHLTR